MDKITHRAAFSYLGIKDLSPKEMHEDMVMTLEELISTSSMITKWAPEFKRGWGKLEK